MRVQWLAALAVLAAMVPVSVGATREASSFTVVVTLLPLKGGYTVQAHTRIGATCDGFGTGFAVNAGMVNFPSQHVGQTGIVSWKFPVNDTRFDAEATVMCTWKSQKATGNAAVNVSAGSRVTGNPPVLGSNSADWLAGHGKPVAADNKLDRGFGQLAWEACPATPKNPPAKILVSFFDDRATDITYWWCQGETLPSVSDRRVLAARFYPSDYRPRGKYATDSGTIDDVFSSSTLGRNVPASLFQDCAGNQAALGSFSLDLGSASDRGYTISTGPCA